MEFHLPTTNFGGTALLIKKDIDYVERSDLQISSPDYESSWIEINKDGEKVIIGCIYRHPASDINEFTNSLEIKLMEIYNAKPRCIICGDINIDALKIDTHNSTSNS